MTPPPRLQCTQAPTYKSRMASPETSFAVLLFSDIVGSSDLKAKHGAMAYLSAAELHNALFERLATEEKLTLIKNTGDGYLARTTSIAAAVRFALRLQDGLRTMHWPSFPLATRMGIHAGEVADVTTLGQTDVLGPAADLAARVMSVALGGQILLSRFPFDEARHFLREHPTVAGRGTPALVWLAHGPYLIKGCDEPMELFEVGAEGLAPLVPPPDGEKVRRAIRPGEEETLGWRPAAEVEVPGKPGWLVTEKLGEGGFGEVWLVRQRKTGEQRVFKFCFDAERLRSLKRELSIFRLIRESLGERTDITRMHDVRLDESPFYLESEYIPSGNLVQWSEGKGGIGKIPLDARLAMMRAICRAVAAAHSVGVIHKDIKPSNVLMREDTSGHASPVLADFGIGVVTDASQFEKLGITQAGFTMSLTAGNDSSRTGTRMYAPPESLLGKPPTVQTDVYALGVLLYQLAIGDLQRPLATGWEKGVADPILREDIAAATEGSTEDRLRDVGSLLDRITSQPERRKKLQRAQLVRKTAVALAAAAVLVLVAVLGNGTLQKGKINRLNTQIQQRLESGSLSEKDVAETDRLVADLAGVSPENADEQRRRVTDQITNFARTAIHRANLADSDQHQIESWLALLQPRDAARAAQLRTELAGRLRQWDPAYELKPPFDKARDLGGLLSGASDELRFAQAQVPLPVEAQGAMRVEADFASPKDAHSAFGFAFEDEQKRTYTFRVIPPPQTIRTKYALDLQSPEFAERLRGWSTGNIGSASISLVSGKPVLRLERRIGDPGNVGVRKLFAVGRRAGKIWTVSWRSRVTGMPEPDKGITQLYIRSVRKDGKGTDVTSLGFKKNGDWCASSRTFTIPSEAARLEINFEFKDTTGALEVADLRIVEKEAAGEDTAGVEVFSLPQSEWHPAVSEAGLWMPNLDEHEIALREEDGRKFLRLSNESGFDNNLIRSFRIDPSLIKSVSISARIRVPFDFARGLQSWNYPRVGLNASDRSGKILTSESLTQKPMGDWTEMKATTKSVSKDWDRITFGVFVQGCQGAIDVSDLTCELELKPPKPGAVDQAQLAILRGNMLLTESLVPGAALAGDSVRVAAERVGNSLRVQVGQKRPLEVFDPFPHVAQNFHPVLLTAPDLSLRSLAIFRQRLPEKPQPLELGDAQFSAGNYAGAMSVYEAQLPTAIDAATREQARFKIGLCLLQQKRAAEAEVHFIEAAKADARPWADLASFQLLGLYLGQRRVADADAVLAALRARRDFVEMVGILPSDLRQAFHKGYTAFSRNVMESGDRAECIATIERLQHVLEIADALQMDPIGQYWLRFEICRLYAVTGQTTRTLEYCVEQLNGMEKDGISYGYLSGMFAEMYYTLMAKSGHGEKALPLLQKWDALTPNEFPAIQTTRCLLAMKRFPEADAKITGLLNRHQSLESPKKINIHWIYAALLRGLIAETRDGPQAGRAAWAAEFRVLRDAAPNHDPAYYLGNTSRPMLLSFIILGGLSGELTDEDMPSLRKAISDIYSQLDAGTNSARQMMLKNMPALVSRQVALSLCTGERGAVYARSFIRGGLLFSEAYRMPFIFMLDELFIQGGIGREKLTSEQEAVYWRISEMLNDALRDKQLSSAQMLSVLAAWKGVTNLFGWAGAEAQLQPKMRGPLAYIMGQRYVKLGKKEDALGMFRTAKADAAQLKDAPLAALADSEIKNLGGN